MLADYLASLTVRLLVALVGQEEAPRRVSMEAQRRAKAAADAVARARQAAERSPYDR